MKRILCFLLILMAAVSGFIYEPEVANVCRAEAVSMPETKATVTRDNKYGGAIISLSQQEFEKAGFTLGDSCDVEFGNGYTLKDVPYFNGYYVKSGMPLIIVYPGDGCVKVTKNNKGIWDEAKLHAGESVIIRLNQAGRFLTIQSSLSQVYSTDRGQYSSDEEYCNFRALSGGSLKENLLYRGASPIDNHRGRAGYTDRLLKQYGLSTIIDLDDSQEEVAKHMAKADFQSPYFKNLYDSGNVILLHMSSDFSSPAYKQKLAAGMRKILEARGKIYIHCLGGKDRTGVVSALLEALAGADYAEMQKDYMTTYKNYYGITRENTPEKYDAIVKFYFDDFLGFLHGTDDINLLRQADYSEDAKAYLISGGMTESEVKALQEFISKK